MSWRKRLHDENRITLPELDAKLKHLNTKKAKGHDRVSNKIISYLLPSLTSCLVFLSTLTTILWFGNERFLKQIRKNQTLAVSDPYLSSAISGQVFESIATITTHGLKALT